MATAKKEQKARGAPSPVWAWASPDPDAALRELCDYVSSGNHLNDFCKSKGFPYSSLLWWMEKDPKRVEMYARAREARADVLADEIVSISDEHGDSDAVARNRLRVDARKWVASKLKPRTYGEKTQTELTGKDGGPIVVGALNDAALEAIIRSGGKA
jgi:hypothetical protein